ncbi:MAG: hypothetical protein LC797_24945 [Chloroflexi bacterium]|nr:hypothetical protein [Chloroflexota bacterium]
MRQPQTPGEEHEHGEGVAESVGRLAYLAELQCFMCGNLAGSIESDRKPLPPSVTWHPANGDQPQRLADWRQLRCGRCGGALFAESVEAVVRYDDPQGSPRQVPRRGRPPKWLVEQRRRLRDAAETYV